MKSFINDVNTVVDPATADVVQKPIVRILYCTSWGMKNNFLGLKNYLESKYPVFQGNVIGH